MQHGQSHVRALYPQGDLPDVALELMIDGMYDGERCDKLNPMLNRRRYRIS